MVGIKKRVSCVVLADLIKWFTQQWSFSRLAASNPLMFLQPAEQIRNKQVNISYFLAAPFISIFYKREFNYLTEYLDVLIQENLIYNTQESPNLAKAVIFAEDRKFYTHNGVDYKAIVRASLKYLSKRRIEGASTIEQQLVRVARDRYEITLGRKLSEIVLAVGISKKYEKDMIIELYMQIAYFGWNGNGIRQICDRLDSEPNSLSNRDAANIATMLKFPLPKTPSQNYMNRFTTRRDFILRYLNK